jgi:hypothetical protein
MSTPSDGRRGHALATTTTDRHEDHACGDYYVGVKRIDGVRKLRLGMLSSTSQALGVREGPDDLKTCRTYRARRLASGLGSTPEGARYAIEVAASPRSLFGHITAPLVLRFMRRAERRNMTSIKAVLESTDVVLGPTRSDEAGTRPNRGRAPAHAAYRYPRRSELSTPSRPG